MTTDAALNAHAHTPSDDPYERGRDNARPSPGPKALVGQPIPFWHVDFRVSVHQTPLVREAREALNAEAGP